MDGVHQNAPLLAKMYHLAEEKAEINSPQYTTWQRGTAWEPRAAASCFALTFQLHSPLLLRRRYTRKFASMDFLGAPRTEKPQGLAALKNLGNELRRVSCFEMT
eukprot:scaffold48281_cov15-Tisochrysis_lutea.AAC.2